MLFKSQKECVKKYPSDFNFRVPMGDDVLEYYRQSLFRFLRVNEEPFTAKAVIDRMEERGFESVIVNMIIRNSADQGDIGFGKGFKLIDQTNHQVCEQDYRIEVDFILGEKEALEQAIREKDLEISFLDCLACERLDI